MFTEHSITHLLQLPALSFPRVIIISSFLKTIYNKVVVHLYVFTFVETIFNLKNGVLLIQLTSELHTNILIIEGTPLYIPPLTYIVNKKNH